MINLTYYFDPNDESHVGIEQALQQVGEKYEFNITRMDITTDRELYSDLGQTPIIKVGPYTLQGNISEQQIMVSVGAAIDRDRNLRKLGDTNYEKKVSKGKTLTGPDKITLFVTKHYMLMFNFVVLLYVGLPFLAPVFMNAGFQTPAKIIYTIYKPLCHQLTFRSFFLFGEQPYYPRALANVDGVMTYEDYFHKDISDLQFAREFVGDKNTGYKVALCERDVALYGSFFLFGVIFHITGRRIKKIPWYIWILLGVLPMGIDGSSQLPGMISSVLPSWMLVRESTPFLRVLTGSMFGVFTAWYLYPMVEETMKDTRKLLYRKKNYVEQSSKQANVG
jgi:uncharacterized membrane protein